MGAVKIYGSNKYYSLSNKAVASLESDINIEYKEIYILNMVPNIIDNRESNNAPSGLMVYSGAISYSYTIITDTFNTFDDIEMNNFIKLLNILKMPYLFIANKDYPDNYLDDTDAIRINIANMPQIEYNGRVHLEIEFIPILQTEIEAPR